MSRINFICTLLVSLAFSSMVFADNTSSDRIKPCRTGLQACQKDTYTIIDATKNNEWDYVLKKYTRNGLVAIRNLYFDYFACQYEYDLCVAGEEADVEVFHKQVSNTPETQWELSTPAQEGVDASLIQKVHDHAAAIEDLRSLLIVKNGKLIYESYFAMQEDKRPHWCMSTTKSIVSLLVGIAIDKGYISSEDIAIQSYFPEYFATRDHSPKNTIKIVDLLRMKSGLDFSDKTNWRGAYGLRALTQYWHADNAKDLALHDDLAYIPGQQYQYSTPAVDTLTAILNKATGSTAAEFAEEHLFNPLGIYNYVWAHDSHKFYRGGYVLFLRPRSLAKIGQVVLDNGRYESKQLISSDWLEKTFQVHQTYVWEGVMQRTGIKLGYGYLWYISELNGYEIRFTWGYGGQFIIAVPNLNLVITTTATPDVSLEDSGVIADEIFDTIVRALL